MRNYLIHMPGPRSGHSFACAVEVTGTARMSLFGHMVNRCNHRVGRRRRPEPFASFWSVNNVSEVSGALRRMKLTQKRELAEAEECHERAEVSHARFRNSAVKLAQRSGRSIQAQCPASGTTSQWACGAIAAISCPKAGEPL